MKTMKHVQKTENKKTLTAVSKTFAVAASLVLLSLTSSASGFWKQVMVNNSFGKMAVMMDDRSFTNEVLPLWEQILSMPDSDKMDIGVFGMPGLASNSETPFETEVGTAGENPFEPKLEVMEIDAERPLTLEPWMIDDNFWEPGKVDAEPILKIEGWMINEKNWSVK